MVNIASGGGGVSFVMQWVAGGDVQSERILRVAQRSFRKKSLSSPCELGQGRDVVHCYFRLAPMLCSMCKWARDAVSAAIENGLRPSTGTVSVKGV